MFRAPILWQHPRGSGGLVGGSHQIGLKLGHVGGSHASSSISSASVWSVLGSRVHRTFALGGHPDLTRTDSYETGLDKQALNYIPQTSPDQQRLFVSALQKTQATDPR